METTRRASRVPLRLSGVPSAFHVAVRTPGAESVEVRDARSLSIATDARETAELCRLITDCGIWVAMRGVWYTSAAHGAVELAAALERFAEALTRYASRAVGRSIQ
jgi:glutamate-1-semialdehyde 2,1-aminomutase